MNITLKPEVEVVIRRILEDVYPKWVAQEPVDVLRHVNRFTSGYSFEARPHKGMKTWLPFLDAIAPAIHELDAAFQHHQPELLWFMSTSSVGTQLQAETWLAVWMRYLDSSPASALQAKIDFLISDLKRAFAGATKVMATTIVAGLLLPESIDYVGLELGNGEEARVRRMTDDEFSTAYSRDVLSDPTFVSVFRLPDTVIISRRPATIVLTPTSEGPVRTDDQAAFDKIVTAIVQALTLTKSGYFMPISTSLRIDPAVFPARFGTFHAFGHAPRSTVEFQAGDIDELKVNHGRLLDARPEIAIASKRLVDAESRLNPADAVVDAAIGLETLLLRDRQELTYRVKLNYAFLAPFHERRDRVTQLNELYNWRGKIVHGGTSDADMVKLRDIAAIGKTALRYTILQFLRDSGLRKDAKLDNEYWIDRIVRG